jgi:hypothetical protein
MWGRLNGLPNSLKRRWKRLMVEKWTFSYLVTALVDIPAVSMPIVRSLKTCVALCCVTTLHILKWPFIVPSTRCTCVIHMLFNQLLDMPHISGGWIVLAKEKWLLTGMTNKFAQNLREISFLYVWKNSGIFYFSSWNMGPTLYMLHLYLFSVYVLHTAEVRSLHTLRWESLKQIFQPLHKFLVNKL